MRDVAGRPGFAIAAGLGLALIGLAMIQWGRSMPPFVDHERALAAYQAWCPPIGGVDHAAGARYGELLTARYDWINLGVGIGFTGLVAALGAGFLAIRRRTGASWLVTPSHRVIFILLGWLVIAWSWLGNLGGLALDLDRMRFPHCADSIGIPAIGLTVFAAILALLLTLVGLLVMRGFGTLPVPLTTSGARSRGWTVTVNIVCAVAALLAVAVGCLMAISADSFGTPAYLVALYLIASARAALLAPA